MKTNFTFKALAIAFVLAFTFNASSAQAQLNGTGNVTLSLDLRNVLQFDVLKSSSKIIFNTVAEYENGTDTTEADQLKISSNLPFKIEVKSSSSHFEDGSGNKIPLSVMKVKAISNSDNDNATPAEITLSGSDGTLISTTSGSINRTYSMKYTATPTATGSSASNEFLKNPTGVYAATLVYTVTQL